MSRLYAKSAAINVLIGSWFFRNAWRGILAYFSNDDLMNMYWAWVLPLHKLALANLIPFTPVYRPLGSLFYRVFYGLFGLNPLPFRIFSYALMLFNIWLIFRLAQLATGSAEIAVLATLFGTYHNRLLGIYLNGGTVYDVLCFTCFYGAICCYVGARQRGQEIRGWVLLRIGVLFVLALNSKEMGATLPIVLLAYEWIYHPLASWQPAAIHEWSRKHLSLWIGLAIVAVATIAKTSAQGSFAGVSAYAFDISVRRFFQTTRPLLSELFFQPAESLNTTKAALLLAVVWAVAIASRQKHLKWFAVLIVVAPLPINFIPYRGFFVMYIPMLGWAVYLASILVGGRDWLWRTIWKRPGLPSGTWEPERVWLFLATLHVLWTVQAHSGRASFRGADPSQDQIRTLKFDLQRIHPSLSPTSRVLFLKDEFPQDSWTPLYVVRLLYHDRSIEVERARMVTAQGRAGTSRKYDYVFTYCDGRYEE